MKFVNTATIIVLFTWTSLLHAEEQLSHAPKPVPATRPEMKAALEALKQRTPRLPLPKSDVGGVNNGRMRAAYLPETWGAGRGRGNWTASRQASTEPAGRDARLGLDSNSAFDHAFTTSLFWVVSRGNNCHYCLGHQELKLRAAGLDDDTIAALDSDWGRFETRQRAALAYARKLTLEPHLAGDNDIARLKNTFSDLEIIELTFNIARFNATNRWTDGLGLPQDTRFGAEDSRLDTPTSEQFQTTVSLVTPATRAARPPLATLKELQDSISACRKRQARVALPVDDEAETAVAGVVNRAPLAWERAMARVPGAGPTQAKTINTIMADEHLPIRLKAELALISAMHNQAWYAVGHAAHRLRGLGVSMDDMVALFNDDSLNSTNSAAAHRLAKKLTTDPHLITDMDIAQVRAHFSDHETAQIVHVICMTNFFDRFTEALSLPLEDNIYQ